MDLYQVHGIPTFQASKGPLSAGNSLINLVRRRLLNPCDQSASLIPKVCPGNRRRFVPETGEVLGKSASLIRESRGPKLLTN